MSKTYELGFTAETIDKLLDSVDKKTIYAVASEAELTITPAQTLLK